MQNRVEEAGHTRCARPFCCGLFTHEGSIPFPSRTPPCYLLTVICYLGIKRKVPPGVHFPVRENEGPSFLARCPATGGGGGSGSEGLAGPRFLILFEAWSKRMPPRQRRPCEGNPLQTTSPRQLVGTHIPFQTFHTKQKPSCEGLCIKGPKKEFISSSLWSSSL